jgi:hypothetical protein
MCKYPLFFQNILKKTPTDHENYRKLKEAGEAMTAMAEKVNEKMKAAQNSAKVFEIYTLFNCEVNFIEPSRRLVMETNVFFSTATASSRSSGTFFFFNDYILIGTMGKKVRQSSLHQNIHTYLTFFYLYSLVLCNAT